MPTTPQERLARIALGLIPQVGGKTGKSLINYCGSAEAVFKRSKGQLLKIPAIREEVAEQITSQGPQYLQAAEKEVAQTEKLGVSLLFMGEEGYPFRLKYLPDAPPVLYHHGQAELNPPCTVAIVGTRKATAYGREITQQIVEDLKPYGATIVSGLAYGIDIVAHRKALEVGLPTLAVMANGLDHIYPADHQNTAREIAAKGGLLTEQRLGTKAKATFFPARNRIIAGLADVTILVEAAEKGGGLITANLALDYERELFAVPGNLGQTYSQGTNKLIAHYRAHLFRSVEELAQTLGWNRPEEKTAQQTTAQADLFAEQPLGPDEQKVVELLQQEGPLHIDQLAWQSGIQMHHLASMLLNLEFSGYVRALPGKKYGLAARRKSR